MKTAKQLREEKAPLVAELRTMVDLATQEGRELTEAENTRSGEISTALDELEQRAAAAEARESVFLAHAGGVMDDAEGQERTNLRRSYSFLRAVRAKIENRPLDGVEAEMHQEAVQEAQQRGGVIEGIGIPEMLFTKPEERAYSVGAADNGAKTVETRIVSFIDALRPKLLVEELGATPLTGLTGNVKIPALDSHSTGTWEGETDEAAEKTATIGERSLTPNRVSAWSRFSKQLFAQSSQDVERMILGDLGSALKIAKDAAAINGTGSGQPLGILNASGINVEALGTNGAAATFANMVALESLISAADADVANMQYLVTPGLRGFLKTLKKDAGSGEFVWNDNMVNGYNAFATTQMPSNLTKGTGTDLHAAIFGDWSSLIVASWAGLDIVVDPYSAKKNAQIEIAVNEWCDVAIRHAAAFAAIKDAVVS